MWTYWNESSKGPCDWLRDWCVWHTGRPWESWDCPVWNMGGSGDLISVYRYLMKGTKEGRSGLFSVVPSDWARGNGYQWKHKEILLNMEDLFTYKGCRTLAQAAQRGDGDHLGWLDTAVLEQGVGLHLQVSLPVSPILRPCRNCKDAKLPGEWKICEQKETICSKLRMCRCLGDFFRRDFIFSWTHRDRRETLLLGTVCPQCRQLCLGFMSWLWNVLCGQHRLKNIQVLKSDVLL